MTQAEVSKGSEQPPGQAVTWLARALSLGEGEAPFPWQIALLEQMCRGMLPRALDLPTGIGKTSVMAIWLVARACGAPLPRRLVYVVDRRAVVDQASAVAESLRAVVGANRDLAEGLSLGSLPLPISTLRGQFVDNRKWLADPAATAIIVGTVDMVGSRLLFEGYGVGRRMRPYHAGLLGADALVVLDESHLVPPFERLLEAVESGDATLGPTGEARRGLVPRFSLLSLSATGRSNGARFTLGDADRAHPVVARRLGAEKRLVVRNPLDTDTGSLAKRLADEAWALAKGAGEPIRCLIFCDRREGAKDVEDALRAHAGGTEVDTELLVGGRRVHEREAAARWLGERGFLAGRRARPTRHAFVVATSAGEVGIDLDADHMVSDVVAFERMIQRLGRVNRRGERAASVVVVPTLPDGKVRASLEKEEGKRNEEDLRRIEARARVEAASELLDALPRRGGAADASPAALLGLRARAEGDALLAKMLARATTPAPLHPPLTRALVEAWSMTALQEHTGRPAVMPWLRGWVEEDPQTAVVFRTLLPVDASGAALSPREVEAFFEAAAPATQELLETESFRVDTWLQERASALVAPRHSEEHAPEEAARAKSDGESGVGEEAPTAPSEKRLRLDLGEVAAFVLPGDGSTPIAVTLEEAAARERSVLSARLRGATLVVDARLGGLSVLGLLDVQEDAATDVGAAPDALPFRTRLAGTDAEASADPNWRRELALATERDAEGGVVRWLVVESRRDALATTEDGRSTAPAHAQLLDEHQAWAERRARDLATRLDLPPAHAETLALAARLHDEGKAARRWQRAFRAPGGGPWAKTTSRPDNALLDGYRHELGSLLRAERDARVAALNEEQRDLCLHLIAAHHGFARPTIPTAGCDDAPPSALVARAEEVALRFARLERRWGPWGLAWWEALLRAADQQASRDNDERGDRG